MGEVKQWTSGRTKAAYVQLKTVHPWSVLDEGGQMVKGRSVPQGLSDKDLVALMHRMVFVRAWDGRAVALARQGRLRFYAPVAGQEATMVASQYALQKQDWILPGYRDIPQIYFHGYPMAQAFLWSWGHQHGGEIPQDVSVLMPQIIIGAQFVQAIGVAMGLQRNEKTDAVVVTYTGDGGSSQGDVYEAMNFAGVYQLPVIFVIQNNRYAISTPVSQQTAAETLAQKGVAAGIPSVQVDGMDALAVYEVMAEARARAVAGGGPTLIEALTYRLGPHSMSGDDPGRYRTDDDHSSHESSEPLVRFRNYLTKRGIWSKKQEDKAIAEAQHMVQESIEKAEAYPAMKMDDLIDSMYEETPESLKKQKMWFGGA